MSTKTLRKRIALVAVASLGFGLMSTVPANAAAAVVADVSVSITAAQTGDGSLSISSAAAGSSVARTYNIYTRNATVAIGLISASITTAGDTTTGHKQLKVAAGTTLSIGSTAVTAFLYQAALVTATPTALVVSGGTSPFATFTASASGTTYLIWNDGVKAADGTASAGGVDSKFGADEAYAQVTFFRTSAEAVTATLDTPSTTIAGRTGQQVTISPRGDLTSLTVGSAGHPVLRIAAAITSQPTGSVVYPTLNAIVPADTDLGFADTGTTVGTTAAAITTGSTGSSSALATINYSGFGNTVVTGTDTPLGTLTFTPTVAGTYTVAVWNESNTSAAASLSGSESSQTFTVNVSTGVSTITMTPTNSTSSTAGASYGSLVKVTLKDAAGNATTLSPGESVTVTPSGSAIIAKVNNSAASSVAGQAWNLSAANFNTAGVAWINVTDTVAESATITASISGGTSASTTLTFATVVDVGATPAISSTATGADVSTGTSMKIPLGASTLSWRATASTGSAVGYSVTESLNSSVGTITGYTTALSYTGVASGNTTLGYASFSVTATTTAAGQSYTLSTDTDGSSTPSTVTSEATTAGVLAVTPSTVNAVTGATNTFTALLKDKFKRAYASQSVSVTVAGKNPTATATTLITDAAGRVTFSLTDANTNTAVTDTVTFTAGSAVAVSVSYGTNAASTVTVASDNYTVTGVANDSVTPNAIATGYTGAQAGARTVTATVKNAAGALLAGVPVVFTVSGTTAAVTSTTQTVYTSVSGTASASVYGWATGTYTVTATAGGVAGTATVTFYSTGDASVRTVSATATGNQVTGMAKDRFGNVVQGATLYAKVTTGGGNIGGALTAQGTTDSTGSVVWVVSDASSTVTVSNIPFSAVAGTVVGQTSAAVGFDVGGAGATAMTATTVGTTTTAETGVGASFAPAGVSSVTVEATVANDASAAADAAAEATDAANAATDAANAAAEAADAATAAAQDAADAVAALSTEVTELISALRKQITSLTNLVIKIQKKVKA